MPRCSGNAVNWRAGSAIPPLAAVYRSLGRLSRHGYANGYWDFAVVDSRLVDGWSGQHRTFDAWPNGAAARQRLVRIQTDSHYALGMEYLPFAAVARRFIPSDARPFFPKLAATLNEVIQ